MNIWLATINGFDGKSIVGVYSNPNLALKGVVEYLTEEDFGKAPVLHGKEEGESLITYKIAKSQDRIVIRKMELDK